MINDADIKRLVLEQFQWDPKVDHTHIGVTASDGSVTLSGHVSSYASKFAATDALKRVRGVKAIADEIDVNLPTELRKDDSDIAERIAHVLEWNVTIPDNSVQAIVSGGFVTLSGQVDYQYQREHIEQQIQHVSAVTGIANRIALKITATPDDVKKRIEDALDRSAELEAQHITVKVKGDTVTLDGKVKAYFERELAEKAAWTAPGVKTVVDLLLVA